MTIAAMSTHEGLVLFWCHTPWSKTCRGHIATKQGVIYVFEALVSENSWHYFIIGHTGKKVHETIADMCAEIKRSELDYGRSV